MHDHVRRNLCLALLCLAATICCGKQVCTFTGLADTAGNNDDWRDYKFMANPDNCKEICSSESWCTAAEFDFYSRSCYLFKGDTPLSHKKDSVFMKKVCTEVTTTSPATESTAPESRTRMSTSTESTVPTQRMSKKVRPSRKKKKRRKPVSLMVKMLHRHSKGDRITPTVAFTTTAAPTTPAPTTPIATSSSTKKLQVSITSRPIKRSRKRIYTKRSRKGQSSRKPKKSRRVKKIRRIIKSRKPTQPPKPVLKKTPVPKITISYNTRKRPHLSKLTQTRKPINIASTTTAVPFIDLNIDSSSKEIRIKAENITERKQKSTYRMPEISIRSKVSVNPVARDANKVDASRALHRGMTSARHGCFYRCPSMLEWYTRHGQSVPFTRRAYFQPLYRIRIPIRLRIPAFRQTHPVQPPQMTGTNPFLNANQNPRQVAFKNTTQHQIQKPVTKPGTNPGHNPAKNPGHYPAKNLGHNPGKEHGHNPGRNPGHNSGKNPVHNPGKNNGYNPGKNPGHYPMKNPGHNPVKPWSQSCKEPWSQFR
ncbi:uncharacterized protein LOC124270627 [Haliotis rubra]|uniref:uncharacterized protein LOC124270627 n=1 Tax=Haliotis rubra TaxID=36100 RepID=UPI001EE573B9|nr:uncharacterized protein LOC124270627 [Haliotis rubra]XP_046561619.1 uncharacterized protein LOC124270627 [Haliotis rubra]XP_046561620.1 uncharacterized protein LOC124270627 [Haliotis rubra]